MTALPDLAQNALERLACGCTGLDVAFTQTLGISGTPGFVVGDKVFNGATDLQWLQAMIAEARRLSVTR
jgi:hypothetical protein